MTLRECYPQTQIQTIGPFMMLLNDLGYKPAELRRMDRACHFAMKLWSVNFQSSSRPFICHAVGTAAVLARNGASTDAVLAGVLHAAYSTGDFGVRIGGATERKRRQIRSVIGSTAEDLVYGFYCLLERYETNWVEYLEKRGVDGLSDRDRTLFLMRVCNDIDDVSDLSFSSPARRLRMQRFVTSSIKLAAAIERPELATELRQKLEAGNELDVLPGEDYRRYYSGHIMVPATFRKRLIPAIREVLHRWRTTGSPRWQP